MTPQERLEFNQMKRDLENIKRATDVSFLAELSRRLAGTKITLESGSLTGTTVSVRDAADVGSETVADDYDGVINLIDGAGNTYRIGYYT